LRAGGGRESREERIVRLVVWREVMKLLRKGFLR